MKKTFVIIAAVLLTTACGQKKSAVVEEPKVLTKTEAVTARTIEQAEEFTAEIQPWVENSVAPAAQGVHIDRILVDVGAKVGKGQLLMTLDPTQYNQQRVLLQTAQNDYNRLKPVFEAGGISAQQFEQAKAQLDIQRETTANLQKNIRVVSPISGVVTARNNDPGDLYTGAPVLHVMQIDPVKVIVNITEQFFPYVKVNMPVDVRVEVFPDQIFKGTVSRIHPALDPATRTFTVEVKVPNRGEVLRPGMYSRTTFNMGEKAGILVPDVSILKQTGSSERYLYVIQGDSAVRRSVKVGRQVGDRVDILSGVAVGEQVAVTGLSKMSDGAKVEVRNDDAGVDKNEIEQAL